ncbi:MAG: hypothetical protein FWG94_09100 [Oscillospiraceae bacterium]|nr:hypothetical protein [Oscillospiraceae bacterium]
MTVQHGPTLVSPILFPVDLINGDGSALGVASAGITKLDANTFVISWAARRAAGLSARISVAKGSQFIDGSPSLVEYGKPGGFIGVEIGIKDKIKSVNKHDLAFTVTIAKGSTRIVSTSVDTTISNGVYEVDKNTNYAEHIDPKGHILNSLAYNSDVEVLVGEEVYFKTRLFQNRRYWAWADMDGWDIDDAMKKQYPAIVEVVNLDWLGYNDVTTTVNFKDFASDNYWVYSVDSDGGLVYAGRSNQWVELNSTKYYLANRELNVDSDIEPEDDIDDEYDDVPEINPITGGDDVYPSNVNDNPGTGK